MQKGVAVEDLEFACEEPLPVAGLASRMAKVPGSAAVLWLQLDTKDAAWILP